MKATEHDPCQKQCLQRSHCIRPLTDQHGKLTLLGKPLANVDFAIRLNRQSHTVQYQRSKYTSNSERHAPKERNISFAMRGGRAMVLATVAVLATTASEGLQVEMHTAMLPFLQARVCIAIRSHSSTDSIRPLLLPEGGLPSHRFQAANCVGVKPPTVGQLVGVKPPTV